MRSRRDLLKTMAAGLAAWPFPRPLPAAVDASRFYFIGVDSRILLPVADPVAWALENQGWPVLERAAPRLSELTADDGERIIRLVLRRCGLNLVETRSNRVTVDHWGQRQADLRPFFKEHRLARPEVVVELRNRKKGTTVVMAGDHFLFGEEVADHFPIKRFQDKWNNRFVDEPDDRLGAPETRSGFAWTGVEDDRVPWMALKSVWRRMDPKLCFNCDSPTILANFGAPWASMFRRSPRIDHVCPQCRRSFRDEIAEDPGAWILANLDPNARPEFQMIWNRRTAWKMARADAPLEAGGFSPAN